MISAGEPSTRDGVHGGRVSAGFMLVVAFLFLVSGAVSLVYQVAWTRMFTTVFGSTTYAVSAVLTAFMAGLALGSFVFGRFIDKKKRVLLIYALLEVGIGTAAVMMPEVVASTDSVLAALYRSFPASPWLLTLVKTLLSFAILLVPTFLMGATLPVLSRFVVERTRQVGSRVGLLYAVNTFGATAGCLITGFFLIETLGVRGTVYAAAAVNFGLAVAFFVLEFAASKAGISSAPEEAEEEETDGAPLSPGRIRILLIGFGLAGFCSLAYEVLWFRVLVFQLKTTTYSFSVMLAAFLTGIALGSAVFSAWESRFGSTRGRRLSRGAYWRLFGSIEAAIGILGLLSIAVFAGLEAYAGKMTVDSWTQKMTKNYVMAAAVMMVPAILMGMAFPVVCRIVSRNVSRVGASVGGVYAANTLGCIFGPLVTGFFLVRALGTQWSIITIACLNLLVATMIILTSGTGAARSPEEDGSVRASAGSGRRIAFLVGLWTVAAAIVNLIPGDLLFHYYNVSEKSFDSRVEILYAHEGLECITTVHRYPDGRRVISTGSVNVAGTELTLRTTQKLQAHVPLLLHPGAKEVLQIGFGSGETSSVVTSYDIERLDLVDISEGVIETAAQFFTDINNNVVGHSKFNPIIMDGADYLRVTDRTYDIIMNDATWPYLAGCNALYTRDHFEAGRDRLNPGGIMTSWFPLDMASRDFEVLLRTFRAVFPRVQVWVGMTHRNKHCLVLGSLEPITINVPRFLRRFYNFAFNDLREVGLHFPAVFLSSLVMDEKSFFRSVMTAPLNTNDMPVLEFASSRRTGMYTDMLDAFRFIRANRATVQPYLTWFGPRHEEGAVEFENKVAAATRAASHIVESVILREEQDPRFMDELQKALDEFPDHPGAIYLMSEVQSLAAYDTTAFESARLKELLNACDDFLKAGAFNKAKEVLAIANEKYPDDFRVHYKLGMTYFREDSFAEAEAALRTTLELKPDFAETWSNLGLILVRQNRTDEGIEAYREALLLKPDMAQTHYNLGLALARQWRFEDAIACYEKALELRPDPHSKNTKVHEALDAARAAAGN